jgi:hypothetical protein
VYFVVFMAHGDAFISMKLINSGPACFAGLISKY